MEEGSSHYNNGNVEDIMKQYISRSSQPEEMMFADFIKLLESEARQKIATLCNEYELLKSKLHNTGQQIQQRHQELQTIFTDPPQDYDGVLLDITIKKLNETRWNMLTKIKPDDIWLYIDEIDSNHYKLIPVKMDHVERQTLVTITAVFKEFIKDSNSGEIQRHANIESWKYIPSTNIEFISLYKYIVRAKCKKIMIT